MRKLVLFDIDGTLVLTGGAGTRALNRAFADLLGVNAALRGGKLAGRTDRAIIGDVLVESGVDAERFASAYESLRDRYVEYLRSEMQLDGPGKQILPGVRQLLDTLVSRNGVGLGLLTGNFQEGARIKLEHFGLWRFFPWGAFGDVVDRNALLPVALDRARREGFSTADTKAVFVIGDTPQDVACARAGGATSIGVATGPYSPDVLRQSRADVVLPDLADTARIMELIDGI
jgi:phosphoglycolate phosphatase-like HAD superfamily hydrolase